MTALQVQDDIVAALRGLLEKYGIEPAGTWRFASAPEATAGAKEDLLFVPGHTLEGIEPGERIVPLLPWRVERRFVELKRLVDEKTVVPLVMCRLARFTDGGEEVLCRSLYRMFDLCQWLAGERIATVFASLAKGGSANVICRLANDVLSSIEVSGTLPAGSEPIDRHELIARRGVACDRAVDTQVPQCSIYLHAEDRSQTYTDTDAELFGLSPEAVLLVRAAYQVLVDPGLVDQRRGQHKGLRALVELAFMSDRVRQRLMVEGA